MARPVGESLDEDLNLFEAKLKVVKLEYEQYFLGNRPREPVIGRGELQKIVSYWSHQPIRNTAARFRFNTVCARFFSMRRLWDETVRKIEAGTYEPHNFKAKLREGQGAPRSEGPAAAASDMDDVFDAYVEARKACGESVDNLQREQLAGLLKKKEAALCQKLGCEAVKFRVVVEEGKARLKASPLRNAS